jgi:hypothetical protein
MSYQIDAKWLLLLPIGSIVVFVSWVLWNLSKEIWAERRRRVRTFRVPRVKIHMPESQAETRFILRDQAKKRASQSWPRG